MVKALLAALAALVLAGCAVGLGNVRACYQGSRGMICGSGSGSTGQTGGGYPPPYGYQGGQYFGQPIFVLPPVFYQPQVPPPTLFQSPIYIRPQQVQPGVILPVQPGGFVPYHPGYCPSGGRMFNGRWGCPDRMLMQFEVPKTDWMPDIQVAPLDRQQSEEDFLAFRDAGPV